MAKPVQSFDQIQSLIHNYMTFDNSNDYIIDLTLATALSLQYEKPVWLMVVAPPSSGKTELLRIISGLKFYHPIHNLTPRFLFSGHPQAKGGFMIRQVGEEGILAFPDFTTVLSTNSAARGEIMNQLRVIYDGEAGLGTGIDMGAALTWIGKVALIACVTQAIEGHRDVGNDLGDRFLYYRYNPSASASSFRSQTKEGGVIRKSVPRLVRQFLDRKRKQLADLNLTEEEIQMIDSLAQFIARGRAAVERDRSAREITNIHSPEQPHRLAIALANLFKALKCIHDGSTKRARSVLVEVAKSTIPAKRSLVLDVVSSSDKSNVLADLRNHTMLPDFTLRRVVEEMEAQKMLLVTRSNSGNAFSFVLHPGFRHVSQAAYNGA